MQSDVEPGLLARAQSYLAAGAADRTEPGLDEAWEDFALAVEPTVHALACAGRRAGLDPADAEQEAWTALVARLPGYRADPERGPFLAWLVVVVHHTLANMARRHAAWRRTPPAQPDSGQADLAGPLEFAERREGVLRGLAAFRAEAGPTAYWLVLLHWVGGYTVDEVAARLGLSHDQAAGLLKRSMPRLRACLGHQIDRD